LPRADPHETSRRHREYVLRVMEHMRMNQAALAKAAGVQPSSLSRVLKKDSTGTLHARTQSKLEKASGILLTAVIDTPSAPAPRALEGLGYLPGDIVIVDLDRKPAPGDVVCAQVYDLGRSEPETVMRIYEPPVLVAASFDEQLRRPLMVDDARVKIEGVVLPHRLRPTAPAG
jgi:transcriptional regulator with XRE-family HTH domain